VSGNGKDKQRDANGRFVAGNKGGPGGSRRRAFDLRHAARDAIAPEHVEAMMRKAARMALEGNLAAMRLVLDRACGRVTESPKETTPTEVDLPALRTAADCAAAVDQVIAGIVRGTVDRDTAKLLVDAIQVRVRSIEAQELEERLSKLEQAADVVGVKRQ